MKTGDYYISNYLCHCNGANHEDNRALEVGKRHNSSRTVGSLKAVESGLSIKN